jgi:hypothetical protein
MRVEGLRVLRWELVRWRIGLPAGGLGQDRAGKKGEEG